MLARQAVAIERVIVAVEEHALTPFREEAFG
jgi:hypothetical protein